MWFTSLANKICFLHLFLCQISKASTISVEPTGTWFAKYPWHICIISCINFAYNLSAQRSSSSVKHRLHSLLHWHHACPFSIPVMVCWRFLGRAFSWFVQLYGQVHENEPLNPVLLKHQKSILSSFISSVGFMSCEGLVKVLLGNINTSIVWFWHVRTWIRFMLQKIQCSFDSNFLALRFKILFDLLKYVLLGS